MTAVLVIAGVVAILDQLTKAVALDRLAPGVPVQLIDGLLALTLVKNEGLAFGLLAGLPPAWGRLRRGPSRPLREIDVGERRLEVARAAAGTRLDRWLAAAIPELSRVKVREAIDAGRVRVAGAVRKASHRLRGGETIDVDIPPPPPEELQAEPIALRILSEDEHVLVVDKPSGMVVHPGAGHARGTLAAAVLAHAPGTAGVGGPPRPGGAHRLAKGPAGRLVGAKKT